MEWTALIIEDDFGGFANSSATIGGAAVNGAATTATRREGGHVVARCLLQQAPRRHVT